MRPLAASWRIASRTGVREMWNRRASSVSSSAAPGGNTPRTTWAPSCNRSSSARVLPFPRTSGTPRFSSSGPPCGVLRSDDVCSGSMRGSSMPCHVSANLGEVRLAGASLVGQPAVEYHQDPVGKLKKFVEIFADQEHGGTAVTDRHDLGMDL